MMKRTLPQAINRDPTVEDQLKDDLDRRFLKALLSWIALRKEKKKESNAMVDDYETTLNSARIVYCGCGTPMIGSSVEYGATRAQLFKDFKGYVFDPACSEKCCSEYGYYCPSCWAPQARVYGPGQNGDLHCTHRCQVRAQKRKQEEEE